MGNRLWAMGYRRWDKSWRLKKGDEKFVRAEERGIVNGEQLTTNQRPITKIEPSPRLAAGRVHRKDEGLFSVRSLTPPQAARNALAIAVDKANNKRQINNNTQTQNSNSLLVFDLV